jgi:hypothetical protein
MASKSIIQYLQGNEALTKKLGGVQKICLAQATTDIKMPYLVVERAGGVIESAGALYEDTVITVRISIDVGAAQKVTGMDCINLARKALHNYRGSLMDMQDTRIECAPVSEWAGLDGATRYSFVATTRYKELKNNPKE